MKNVLMINYWLMMFGWCMFLNGYDVISAIVFVVAIGFLSLRQIRFDFWRFVSVLSFNIFWSLFLLNRSSVSDFFGHLPVILLLVSVDVALFNEAILPLRKKCIYPSFSILVCLTIFSFALVYFLPAGDYSLFGKDNLLYLVSMIYGSFLLDNIVVLFYKWASSLTSKRKLGTYMAQGRL